MVLTESNREGLQKGDVAPDFHLKGTDDKLYSLSDFKNAKALLVIFMCNHCPYVIPKIPEINRIASDFKDLVVIGINPNDSTDYPEDSFENMKKLAVDLDIKFFYLRDEKQSVAKSYGAVCTPDPFLFDENFKLIFHGRIDDVHADKPVARHELYDAVKEFLEKGTISIEEKPSMGCSIKWKY